MPILTWILAALLVIALHYIAVQFLMHWLERQGGFTIRIVWEDENEL